MQGPFSMGHLRALQKLGTVQDDTLVLAAAKGPSLLKDVVKMHDMHQTPPSAR